MYNFEHLNFSLDHNEAQILEMTPELDLFTFRCGGGLRVNRESTSSSNRSNAMMWSICEVFSQFMDVHAVFV